MDFLRTVLIVLYGSHRSVRVYVYRGYRGSGFSLCEAATQQLQEASGHHQSTSLLYRLAYWYIPAIQQQLHILGQYPCIAFGTEGRRF
jgi:hypothetical protein